MDVSVGEILVQCGFADLCFTFVGNELIKHGIKLFSLTTTNSSTVVKSVFVSILDQSITDVDVFKVVESETLLKNIIPQLGKRLLLKKKVNEHFAPREQERESPNNDREINV
mgnify:CR=1 FL=1